MTSTIERVQAPGVSYPRLLARTCAAEWTRLWTVKVTWWFLAAAAVITLGIGTTMGLDIAGDPPSADKPAAWVAGGFTAMPAQFAFLALVLLAVTSDYATGGIIPTLQWTPRRPVLLAARTLVPVAVATGVGVLLAIATSLVAWSLSDGRVVLQTADGFSIVGWIALVYAAGTTMAAGLGFFFRSTAGGIITVFLLILVLPALLPNLGAEWLAKVAEWLPGTGAAILLLGEGPGDTTKTVAALTLLAWAAGAMILGGLRLMRTDADR